MSADNRKVVNNRRSLTQSTNGDAIGLSNNRYVESDIVEEMKKSNSISIRKPGTIGNNGVLEKGNVVIGTNLGPDMPPTYLQQRLDVKSEVKMDDSTEAAYLEALRKETLGEETEEYDIEKLAHKLEGLFQEKLDDDRKGYGDAENIPDMIKNVEKKVNNLIKILKVLYLIDDLQQRYNALINHHGLGEHLEYLNC